MHSREEGGLQVERRFADLETGGYPGLSGWARCHHKGPYTWTGQAEEGQPRRYEKELARCCWLWRWRKGPQARESR